MIPIEKLRNAVIRALLRCGVYDDDIEFMTNIILDEIQKELEKE